MAEYISKAAIMAHIEEQSREWGEEYDAEQILGDIEDFPVADVVERKIGKWEHDESNWENRFICSACGHKIFEKPTNYCPSCWAVMVWYERRADDV